jgi:radical SAM protein with 4Fe4S-binding SPASM domain
MDGELLPQKARYRRYAYKPGSFERIRVPTVCRRIWDMSNIFSNGDVAPCCYDYSGTMKVGNVAEQPFTAIWNSAPYRELRQRIHQDMQSFPLCRNCGINFQLSRTGWFIEQAGFAVHGTEGFVSRWRRKLRPPLARRVFHAARRRLLSGRT